MVLLYVSSNDFLQKFNILIILTSFSLKRLSCEILFSDFVYLLLDRIINIEYFKN